MNSPYLDPAQYIANIFGISHSAAITALIALAVWTILWKGLAMWRSARNRHTLWFFIFLILNDLGILEILYLFWFNKRK